MILGALHSSAGELEASRHAFERASRRRSITERRCNRWRSSSCRWADRGAVRILTPMTFAAPRDVQIRLTLAQALVALASRGGRAGTRRSAGAGAPDRRSWFALASGYLRVKKIEAAESLFAASRRPAPLPETYVLIGRTYRDFQQYDRARAALQRALKMDPRVRRAHYYLGTTALLEEGFVLLDEAIAEFRARVDDFAWRSARDLSARRGCWSRHAGTTKLCRSSKRGARPSALIRRVDVSGTMPAGAERAADAVVSLRRALEMVKTSGATNVERLRTIHYQLGHRAPRHRQGIRSRA